MEKYVGVGHRVEYDGVPWRNQKGAEIEAWLPDMGTAQSGVNQPQTAAYLSWTFIHREAPLRGTKAAPEHLNVNEPI